MNTFFTEQLQTTASYHKYEKKSKFSEKNNYALLYYLKRLSWILKDSREGEIPKTPGKISIKMKFCTVTLNMSGMNKKKPHQ